MALETRSLRDGASSSLLLERYRDVRSLTEWLVEPLSPEDSTVQSMPDASPAKWHLAHTSWFFETFVLERASAGFRPFDPRYRVLFNSYYNSVGDQHPRPDRGLVSRPSLREVREYRAHVDRCIAELRASGADYASNVDPPTYPDGLDIEVFTFAALEQAWRNAREPAQRTWREHTQ